MRKMAKQQWCCFSDRIGALILATLGLVGSGLCVMITSLTSREGPDGPPEGPPWPFIIEMTVALTIMLANLSLLYGVLRNNAWMILPWLFIYIIELFAYCVFLGIEIFNDQMTGIKVIVFTSPFFAFAIYLWFVTRSVYLELKENGFISDDRLDFDKDGP
jgi:hypothetical protein